MGRSKVCKDLKHIVQLYFKDIRFAMLKIRNYKTYKVKGQINIKSMINLLQKYQCEHAIQ